ncbi:MAG: GAF domain-containing protein, partial [Pseudomonadota bacterium]|nr:GAF domain-containing protein [Pseudomonadota bacterium]
AAEAAADDAAAAAAAAASSRAAVHAVAEAAHHGVLTDDMVEDLFLRLGELSSCEGVAQASAVALRIVLDLVPAGASAVLIRTRSGDGLRFRAASGPAATRLIDSVIPLDRGIAGYVCQLGVGIALEDVHRDRRHDGRLDRSTGFTTRAMLAVPVRADTGAVYGCLELLNPPRPFTEGDFEVAARVAASLGSFLNSVYAER